MSRHPEPRTSLGPITDPSDNDRRRAVYAVLHRIDRAGESREWTREFLDILGLTEHAETLRRPQIAVAASNTPNHTTTRADVHRRPERPYSASTDPTQTTSTTEECP